MPVFKRGVSQHEQVIKTLERGRVPLTCDGDCDAVSYTSPERLAEIADEDEDACFGVHEPCGTKFGVADLSER